MAAVSCPNDALHPVCPSAAAPGNDVTVYNADPGLCHTQRIWLVDAWHVARAGLRYLSYRMFAMRLRPRASVIEQRKYDASKRLPSPRPNASRRGVSIHRQTLTTIQAIFVLCTIALSMTLAARKLSGQNAGGQISVQAYNPYPPGILPSDLNPEIERV